MSRRTLVAGLSAFVAATSGVVAVSTSTVAEPCPPGMVRAADRDVPLTPAQLAAMPTTHQGPAPVEFTDAAGGICVSRNGPEPFAELAAMDLERSAMRTAPDGHVPDDAVVQAAGQSQALLANVDDVPGARGKWELYGRGPLRSDDSRYPEGSGLGLVHQTGRIDDFFQDVENDRIFAAAGTSGVHLSEDGGDSWRLISDGLPTQAVSAVTWTPEGGPDGTVVAVTGEHTFGAFSYLGAGVWWSRDLGATWNRSQGPLDQTFGFAAEVDPADPDIVYAATGKGLWRSTDAGLTFTDVRLPTGDCAADYTLDDCALANMVTDVEVKAPGGVGPDTGGGDVLAVVGWRGGNQVDERSGEVQSPANGVYTSTTGAPGSFVNQPGILAAVTDGNSDDGGQDVLGRMELGNATGVEQNHDIVYAIVQDARALNGEVLDFQDQLLGVATVLRGVYVSEDWGVSWTLLDDENELSDACAVNASTYCVNGLIEPGAQAWYNQWIEPDPVGAQGGVPTRVAMGLEEIWATTTEPFPAPQNSRLTRFEVVGKYYACANILTSIAPGDCPVAAAGVTSPHPDQHDGIFLVEPDGSSTLLVGHDGGVSTQAVEPNVRLNQLSWDLEQFNGLATLLPYEADIANDGVAVSANQDNGQHVILPEERNRQVNNFGADGVWTRVDPENSDYVWESVQGALFNVSSDGGVTWTDAEPPSPNKQFVPAAEMDPLDADHVIAGGSQVNETLLGAATTTTNWVTVHDLGGPDVPLGSDPVSNVMTAVDVRGDAAYVGFCGTCDTLNNAVPFNNGIATNVGGLEAAEAGTENGWHDIDPAGLPNRFITDVAIDPYDAGAETVYASLGGYFRRWHGPGVFGAGEDDPDVKVQEGNLWRSTDAGVTWESVSGDLPNTTILNVTVRGDQLVVGTDVGVFLSSDKDGTTWAPLGGDQMPTFPIESVRIKADDPDFLLVAIYGAGVWSYEFPRDAQDIDRVEGPDRYATSVALSQDAHPADASVTTVVLARGDAFPDALAGAPLAEQVGGPILLTRPSGLPDVVSEELDRLSPANVIVLGGETAITQAVVGQVEAKGITVERIAGDDRFATAAVIAGRILAGDDVDELAGDFVYVAKGIDTNPDKGWEDALSIAAPAAKDQRPILLTRSASLPDATRAFLEGLDSPASAQIVGGRAAVTRETEIAVQAITDYQGRVAGPTRYGTSVQALDNGLAAKLSSDVLYLARGDNFADALAAAPSVVADGGSFLLVNGQDLDRSFEAADYLRNVLCAVDDVRLVGGTAAISATVAQQIVAIARGCDDVPVATPPMQTPVTGTPVEPEESFTEVVAFGFEADPLWTASAPGGNPATVFTRGAPGDESDNAWRITKEAYQDAGAASVTSPSVTVEEGLHRVRWSETVDTESETTDFATLELSIDAGETWSGVAVSAGLSPDLPDFSDREARVTLPAGDLLLRFRFQSDEGCNGVTAPEGVCARGDNDGYDGFAFDDVVVERVAVG